MKQLLAQWIAVMVSLKVLQVRFSSRGRNGHEAAMAARIDGAIGVKAMREFSLHRIFLEVFFKVAGSFF